MNSFHRLIHHGGTEFTEKVEIGTQPFWWNRLTQIGPVPHFATEITNLAAKVARRFFIRGEVQGVGYRFFAQRAAARHQITGYVRNRDDGTVEAWAEGPPENVEAFKQDLATGPQFAIVEQVEEVNLEPTGQFSSFRIEL